MLISGNFEWKLPECSMLRVSSRVNLKEFLGTENIEDIFHISKKAQC